MVTRKLQTDPSSQVTIDSGELTLAVASPDQAISPAGNEDNAIVSATGHAMAPGPGDAGPAHFEAVRGSPGVIKLVCKTGGVVGPVVRAHLAGRILGEAFISRVIVQSGEAIEVPIGYLPYHVLPLQIQFTSDTLDRAIATPFVMTTETEVSELIGLGSFTVSELRIEQARVLGVVSNAINGITRPVLYARFNGFVVRPIDVEAPQQHDRGGMSARFSGAIRAEDLVDQGLVIDICAIGVDAPIGTLSFGRIEPRALEERLIRMELDIDRLRRSTTLDFSTLLSNVERRQVRSYRRTEEAIQYLTSLVFDRVAAPPAAAGREDAAGPTDMPATAASASLPEELLALRQSAFPELTDDRLTIDADSDLFVFGWYDVEKYGEATYRWMGSAGTVVNPYPDRPIRSVELRIRMYFGSTFPTLSAEIGSQLAVTDMFEVDGERYARFSLPEGASEPGATNNLRVMSSSVGRPSEYDPTSQDVRELSIGVAQVSYIYAPVTPQDIPDGG